MDLFSYIGKFNFKYLHLQVMKKLFLLIVILIFFDIAASGQSCLPLGYHFTSQELIDNFQVYHPGCTEIEGSVTIGGSSSSDITNLDGLSVLKSIGGILLIGSPVGDGNPLLTSLSGLHNLTHISGILFIEHNDMLTSLTGLDSITSLMQGMLITGNLRLKSLTGLEGVTIVGGGLAINFNDSLINLSGLKNITYVGGYLDIFGNDALTSLEGMEGLTSIGGGLGIEDNPSLISLTGLKNVTSIVGSLDIIENVALESLDGLDNIGAGTISDLSIFNNDTLSTCEVLSICNYLASPNGTIDIHDNATGCDSLEEVKAACEAGINENGSQGLCSVYPNPCNSTADFRFLISDFGKVTIKINDVNGREVATVLDEKLPAGMHEVAWDAAGLSPGLYFYKLSEIGNQKFEMGKIVVVR
jgi:hypothetical protein